MRPVCSSGGACRRTRLICSSTHALVRDAAYGSLLRNQRQQLHAHIAAAIETKFPEIVATQPEWLAHHCDEAGWPEKAAQYWRAAGEQAVRRAANVEAIEHFRRALLRSAERPAGIERPRAELAILSQLRSGHGNRTPRCPLLGVKRT